MANKTAMSDYRGKRALIITRVSTAKQEEKYSHAAQERQVREKLIAPLGLRIVDEVRHIIRDTYSGLEYRYREASETRKIKSLRDVITKAQKTACCVAGLRNALVVVKHCMRGIVILKRQ